MGIYIFFSAVAASIFGFSLLRKKQRHNKSLLSLEEQTILLETEFEMKTRETLSEPRTEASSNPQVLSLEDEATLSPIGQLYEDSNVLALISRLSSTFRSTQQAVTDGFSILCEAWNPRELYRLDFSTLSPIQTAINLDYRENAESDSGVELILLNAPAEPITLRICGSEAYRSFFKKENNRFVIIKNDSSRALLLSLEILNFGLNKRTVTKSTKFQPVVISAFECLVVNYFEADQTEDRTFDYIALTRQLASNVY